MLYDMSLFFLSRDHGKLVPYSISVNAPSSVRGRVKMALDELLKGPPALYAQEMVNAIPPGTALQSVWWNDREGRVYASFSEELIRGNRAHALAEWATIYSIVNTAAAQSPAIREVQLLVDGQVIDSAYTVWDWSLPFEPDQVFVDVSESL
jgi:spore germination protein GerM